MEAHRDVVLGVQAADAVRADDTEVVLTGEARDLVLQPASLLAHLGEAREEHRVPKAFPGAVLERPERPGLGDGEQRYVHGGGHVEQAWIAGLAGDLLVAGVDRKDVAAVPVPDEVLQRLAADGGGVLRGADHRDSAGVEQVFEVRRVPPLPPAPLRCCPDGPGSAPNFSSYLPKNPSRGVRVSSGSSLSSMSIVVLTLKIPSAPSPRLGEALVAVTGAGLDYGADLCMGFQSPESMAEFARSVTVRAGEGLGIGQVLAIESHRHVPPRSHRL